MVRGDPLAAINVQIFGERGEGRLVVLGAESG
jgi:hypothetical protein